MPTMIIMRSVLKADLLRLSLPLSTRLRVLARGWLAISIIVLFGAPWCRGQGTYTAASCSQSDVNAVINGPTHVAVNGDTVIIPAGTCTWTSGVTISGKGIDITGTGTPNTGGGTVGAGTANTTIVDNVSGDLFTFTGLTTSSSTAEIELLNLSGAGGPTTAEALLFEGTCTTSAPYCASIRVDNITFTYNTWSTRLGFGLITSSNVFGVLDHNSTSEPCASGCEGNPVMITPNFGAWQGVGNYGGNSFASPDTFGTAQQIYLENNYLSGMRGTDIPGGSIDESLWGGARFTCRFNTWAIIEQSGACENHGTAWSGPARGVRQVEFYYNTMSITGVSCISFTNLLGGTGRFFSNTFNGTCQTVLSMDIPRFEKNSNPWNACDGTQPWDQAPWSSTTQCIDQPGTGVGALLDSDPPVLASAPGTACTTSGQCWSKAASDPVYEAGDTATGGISGRIVGGFSSGAATRVLANRDYFYEVSTSAQSSPTSPFNGSTGTGYGTIANRPVCSSGCATGVGYWATDTGTWNTYNSQQGTLYVWNGSSWVVNYTPYTYPHPLVTGGSTGSSGNPPSPPSGLVATVN